MLDGKQYLIAGPGTRLFALTLAGEDGHSISVQSGAGTAPSAANGWFDGTLEAFGDDDDGPGSSGTGWRRKRDSIPRTSSPSAVFKTAALTTRPFLHASSYPIDLRPAGLPHYQAALQQDVAYRARRSFDAVEHRVQCRLPNLTARLVNRGAALAAGWHTPHRRCRRHDILRNPKSQPQHRSHQLTGRRDCSHDEAIPGTDQRLDRRRCNCSLPTDNWSLGEVPTGQPNGLRKQAIRGLRQSGAPPREGDLSIDASSELQQARRGHSWPARRYRRPP